MIIAELQTLLGDLYRNDYKDDPIIQKSILEMGWAVDRLLKSEEITFFDDYDNVKSKILDETKWRCSDGAYRKST
ncbi:UNVERIFIED_CONTAM: hypothetical protein MX611_00835 [Staphylococcus haemolyticus]